MNNYRFTGNMPEVGLTQIDVEERNISKAKEYLMKKHEEFVVLVVSRIN
jgi:hypothetical protein